MSVPISKESDGVIGIHICERCGGLNRTRFEDHTQMHQAAVCGSCGRGPLTLVYGAAEPVDAILHAIEDAYCRGQVVTCYRIRDTDEWDLYAEIVIAEVIPDEEKEAGEIDSFPDPVEAVSDSLDAAGYNHTFGEKSDPPEDNEMGWDFYIPVRIAYPEEDEKPPTFQEFLNEDV